jgi:hypothetical protein
VEKRSEREQVQVFGNPAHKVSHYSLFLKKYIIPYFLSYINLKKLITKKLRVKWWLQWAGESRGKEGKGEVEQWVLSYVSYEQEFLVCYNTRILKDNDNVLHFKKTRSKNS